MIDVSADAKAALKLDSPNISYKMSVYRKNINEEYQFVTFILPSSIVSESVSLTQSICDSGNIKFGKCNAAEFSFQHAGDVTLLTGDKLMVYLDVFGAFTTLLLGIYYISSIKKHADRQIKTITAHDAMTKFDITVNNWYDELWAGGATFQYVGGLINSLCEHCGVSNIELENFPNRMAQLPKKTITDRITGRQILEALLEMCGMFGIITNLGELRIFTLYNVVPVETITVGLRRSTLYEDYETKMITGALVIDNTGYWNELFTHVIPQNIYDFRGNILCRGQNLTFLANMVSTLKSSAYFRATYTPMDIVCRGLPYLEPGDCIAIELSDETTIKTFVLSRRLKGIKALTDNIRATGDETRRIAYK